MYEDGTYAYHIRGRQALAINNTAEELDISNSELLRRIINYWLALPENERLNITGEADDARKPDS